MGFFEIENIFVYDFYYWIYHSKHFEIKLPKKTFSKTSYIIQNMSYQKQNRISIEIIF